MAKKIKTAEELLLEGFEGSKGRNAFAELTDEEFIGWACGVTKMNNLSCGYSMLDLITVARAVFK